MNQDRFLVFETGGTKLVAAAADSEARLLDVRKIERGPRDRALRSLDRLVTLGEELRREHEAGGGRFRAIGFGYGGGVDRTTRRPLRCFHEEGWEEIDPAAELTERFGLPTAMENDCKLAALGEAWFGAGRGAETVFYVTLGTGVGGGIAHRGSILELSPKGEAEIGHIGVLPDGPLCPCGARGCVEAVASGPGLARLVKWLAEREPALFRTSSLAEGLASGPRLMEAWRTGDRFATHAVETAAEALARATAAAVNLLAPQTVVFGGGVAVGAPDFVAAVAERCAPLVSSYFRESFVVRVSELAERAVTQGAAVLARGRFGAVASAEPA